MKYPDKTNDKRRRRRYKYLINMLGFNPLDLGFNFDYFCNTRAITFSKEIGEGKKICIDFYSWFGKSWLYLFCNDYAHMLKRWDNEIPSVEAVKAIISKQLTILNSIV